MISRKQHLEEMRYALAHNVPVLVARGRLTRRRQIEADEFLANLQNCGTRSRPTGREVLHSSKPDLIMNDIGDDAPWMMRN